MEEDELEKEPTKHPRGNKKVYHVGEETLKRLRLTRAIG